jgi:hypothetical protein
MAPAGGLVTPASLVIEALEQALEDAGIPATRDVGSFQPTGVLVGLPELVGRTLGGRTYEVPVLVVSGDPLNRPELVDSIYALADECARALATDNYRPTTFSSSRNAEPLPALELTITTTIEEV